MRKCIRNLVAVLTAVGLFAAPVVAADVAVGKFDVVVYGATPGGIASAVAVARRNPRAKIALVSPYKRVGGLATNGLSHPDFRTFEARTGLFREHNQRVEKYYADKYGADSPQVKDSLRGTHAEPEVSHKFFREMLDALPGITILTEQRLAGCWKSDDRVASIYIKRDGEITELKARYFVDGTYEGDLMAEAGGDYAVGREGRDEYGESLAPETGDDQVQGYNFRFTMTDVAANRAPVPKPEGYDRNDFVDLLPMLDDGRLKLIFGDPLGGIPGGIYKRQTPILPNGKRDINDMSHGVVRLSLPNDNNAWPEDPAARDAIFAKHVRHNVGMLYFLQHDEAVPQKFRDECLAWGFCKDEFAYNNHLPEQLYVREGRRMKGRYVFTQRDVDRAPGTNHARALFHADAVAMGDYGPNCHGTHHEGPIIGGKHTGEFYMAAAPYQIPYGVLLPSDVTNLAVPVACSSSHIGFCALRLEPIWMSLGQAAGEAIGIALEENDAALGDVAPAAIRERLHETKTATIYTSDVPEESPDFAAVQWWGSLGGFIALDRTTADEPVEYGKRGPQLIGQYRHAFPEHAVELDKPLDDGVRAAWLELAGAKGVKLDGLDGTATRGEFIRRAWKQRS